MSLVNKLQLISATIFFVVTGYGASEAPKDSTQGFENSAPQQAEPSTTRKAKGPLVRPAIKGKPAPIAPPPKMTKFRGISN